MKRILMGVLPLILAANVYADLKVGVVNLDQIVQKSTLAISYNDKISKDFKPRQDSLNEAQQKLQNELDQLNYDSFKLSADERTKLQNTINTDRRNFEMMNAALQKDLAAAQAQYTQDLMKKLSAAVTKIAQDGKYDMIQTTANLLFINKTIDITPQVIDQLK